MFEDLKKKLTESISPEKVDAILKDLANRAKDTIGNSFKMKLKVKNVSGNEKPKYETSGASGFDLRAHLEEDVILKPMERRLIPTGLFFDIPQGFEIQVRPRSGLAAKFGITVLNTPGTVDSDYKGETKVILINLSNEGFKISNGDRIAQGVYSPVMQVDFDETDEINTESGRNSAGFGTTGVK